MASRRVYASLSEMLAHSSEIVGEPSCDYLSEVLQDLRPSGASYGHCRLTRPWGVEFPHDRTARFHFVIHGDCWLRTAEVGPVQLHTGDVAFLPRGVAHVLSDMPQGRTKPLAEFPSEKIGQKTYRLSAGGGGSQTLMSCCSVNFDEPTIHPLLELMPPVLLVQGGTAGDTMLPTLLDAMADEVMEQRVGAATVLARLADVVITRLVRSWAENFHVGTTGWLAAIRDPKIGSALAAIHRRPGNAWSIEGLAKIAGMSRSMFCDRFAAIVGMPPAGYLARWRMHLASSWLGHERVTVAEAAQRLGYQSEAAFSRAFKRLMGVSPSSIRRSGLAGDLRNTALC